MSEPFPVAEFGHRRDLLHDDLQAWKKNSPPCQDSSRHVRASFAASLLPSRVSHEQVAHDEWLSYVRYVVCTVQYGMCVVPHISRLLSLADTWASSRSCAPVTSRDVWCCAAPRLPPWEQLGSPDAHRCRVTRRPSETATARGGGGRRAFLSRGARSFPFPSPVPSKAGKGPLGSFLD